MTTAQATGATVFTGQEVKFLECDDQKSMNVCVCVCEREEGGGGGDNRVRNRLAK